MSSKQTYEFEGFVLYPTALRLESVDRTEIRLEPQVVQLLALLVENHDRVVSKEEINQKIWGGRIVSDASLASRLRAARAAIGDNGSDQRLIKTIPNVGLRFVGDVQAFEPVETVPLNFIRNLIMARPVSIVVGFMAIVCLGFGGWYFGFVQPKANLHAQFDKIPNAAIRYYNHKKFRNTTVEKCMKACLETTEFTCRSFDFYKRLNVCDLSAATADSVGGLKTDYELDPYDHYARKAYPPGPIELGRDDTLNPRTPEPFTDHGVED